MASKILRLLAETDPDLHLALLAQLDLLDLFGRPDEKITPALKAKERAERLQTVGCQALRLYRLLGDHLDQAHALAPAGGGHERVVPATQRVLGDEPPTTRLTLTM